MYAYSFVFIGCARDERNRYCGNVVHPSINPEWELLVDKAIIDCKERDCSNRVCKAAIDKVSRSFFGYVRYTLHHRNKS